MLALVTLVATLAYLGLAILGLGGLAAFVSHPPLIVNALGWGLAFRSGVGVVLTALIVPPLLARIGAEERLLRAHFGNAYDAYRARTSRMIPGIY
jgi:protein-S-isoprenylcysteine O-methyltransferase Ste14